MTFDEMQKGILEVAKIYGERFNVNIDQDFAILKLYEEVGEYAQAVLIHRKKSKPEKHKPKDETREMLGQELADIIGMVIVNADLFGIDLKKAIQDKWLDRV
jgi:NTP pyrophosphatase (non-canonical NTP hydrolase)